MYQNEKDSIGKKLGITKEYNKEIRDKYYDSSQAKKEAKKEFFGDKNTRRDIVTGELLHKDQGSAQMKYHMKTNWAKRYLQSGQSTHLK